MQVDSSESDPSVQAAKPLVSAIVAPPTSVINTPINCSASISELWLDIFLGAEWLAAKQTYARNSNTLYDVPVYRLNKAFQHFACVRTKPGTSPVGEKKTSMATVLQSVPSDYKPYWRISNPSPQIINRNVTFGFWNRNVNVTHKFIIRAHAFANHSLLFSVYFTHQ